MIKIHTFEDRSRLEQLLAELSTSKLRSSDLNLAEQLGKLISVSKSLTMAHALVQLPREAGLRIVDTSAVQEDLLTSREQMMRVITHSFSSDTQVKRIKVPSSWVKTSIEELQSYHPYQRFYSMHQTEMASTIQTLRQRVRAGIAGFSIELHQLAELDKIMAESLSAQTNGLYKVIPKLLEHRFKQLLTERPEMQLDDEGNELRHWLKPGGWLELFYRDMRELLLAELDVRLQPVLGLLEALTEHTNKTSVTTS